MEDVVQELAPSVYGLALWDSEWNSYTNFYLIRRGRGYLLIDGHKDGQREQLAAGLGRVAVVPDRIDVFIATHGTRIMSTPRTWSAARPSSSARLKAVGQSCTGFPWHGSVTTPRVPSSCTMR
jgi:hypothetical protein